MLLVNMIVSKLTGLGSDQLSWSPNHKKQNNSETENLNITLVKWFPHQTSPPVQSRFTSWQIWLCRYRSCDVMGGAASLFFSPFFLCCKYKHQFHLIDQIFLLSECFWRKQRLGRKLLKEENYFSPIAKVMHQKNKPNHRHLPLQSLLMLM